MTYKVRYYWTQITSIINILKKYDMIKIFLYYKTISYSLTCIVKQNEKISLIGDSFFFYSFSALEKRVLRAGRKENKEIHKIIWLNISERSKKITWVKGKKGERKAHKDIVLNISEKRTIYFNFFKKKDKM